MSSLFVVTYVLLWVLVAVLLLLVLLLYRQYGHTLLPAKARMQLAGLDIGKRIPEFDVVSADGGIAHLPPAEDRSPLQVFLLASPGCAICQELWSEVGVLPTRYASVSFWWVSNARPEERDVSARGPLGWTVTYTSEAGRHSDALEIPAFPYAYAIDRAGFVRGKGLMNEIADFEKLIAVSLENMPSAPSKTLDISAADR